MMVVFDAFRTRMEPSSGRRLGNDVDNLKSEHFAHMGVIRSWGDPSRQEPHVNSTLRSRCAKAIGAGALSVTLLSAGTAGAFAASPSTASPSPKPHMTGSMMPHMTGTAKPHITGTAKPTRTGMPMPTRTGMGMANGSITARVSKAQVHAGQSVTLTGRAKGVKVGTKVVLLHMHNGKWTALKSSTVLKNGSSYSLVTKFNNKGKEQLRVMAGKIVSPTVLVTVK
jgi:hypothetical protein